MPGFSGFSVQDLGVFLGVRGRPGLDCGHIVQKHFALRRCRKKHPVRGIHELAILHGVTKDLEAVAGV